MAKMGICNFTDGFISTDFVGPKSDYPDIESFVKACNNEFEHFTEEVLQWVKPENVKEGYCRYFPKAPADSDYDGGWYSFCKSAGPGAFPVWYIEIDR